MSISEDSQKIEILANVISKTRDDLLEHIKVMNEALEAILLNVDRIDRDIEEINKFLGR